MNSITVLDSLDLLDIWRVKNPNLKQFSWRQKSPIIQSRLDYWFISTSLQDTGNSVTMQSSISSDHSAICLSFNSSKWGKHGKSYWKFNNSLCNDTDYATQLSANIKNWEVELVMTEGRLAWEIMKFKIRRFTMSYAKARAQEKRKHMLDMEKTIEDLETNLDEQQNDKYCKAKAEFEKLWDEKTQGLIIRSRCNWYEMGEKNNSYFLGLEKTNKALSTVKRLTNNGDDITDPIEINLLIKEFYRNLYAQNAVELQNDNAKQFLENMHIPKLSEESKLLCEGALTLNECYNALQTLPGNKTPGNDGLSSEFYKTFWHLIGPLLLKSLNLSYQEGQLSTSQRQGVITLIAKKGKDKSLLTNYRPISLLNVDVKIASKSIAKRIANVLPTIIHSDQCAFVKGRYIGDAVHTVSDIMWLSRYMDNPGVLLSLVFQKNV